MSSGTFYEGPLTANPMRVAKAPDGYELRTSEQHISGLEMRLILLEQRIADHGMMIAQLREIVTGQPPFLQPTDDWSLNE